MNCQLWSPDYHLIPRLPFIILGNARALTNFINIYIALRKTIDEATEKRGKRRKLVGCSGFCILPVEAGPRLQFLSPASQIWFLAHLGISPGGNFFICSLLFIKLIYFATFDYFLVWKGSSPWDSYYSNWYESVVN